MKKAYMIFSGYPQDGCLLVFAETANKAKYAAVGGVFNWDYTDMNSRRVPEYDEWADKSKYTVVECNDDLPDGAPEFFSDVEI